MIARLLLGGVAWCAALALFAVLIQRSGSVTHRLMPARDGRTALDGVDAIARALNNTRLSSMRPDRLQWTVTKGMSALREMVVYVAANDPDDARSIAEHIVTPAARAKYHEILVYVQSVDLKKDPVVRRVVWTSRDGYVEMRFQ